MLAPVLGIFLIATLLIAHFIPGKRPSSLSSPLDIDKELPFPAAGQGSSVFSLTSLFGVYLIVFLLLGISALIGMSLGCILGLYLIHRSVKSAREVSFQDLLLNKITVGGRATRNFLGFVALTQLAFAVSELLILNEIVIHGFSVTSGHSFVLAISIALVGYFYCLFGGYVAVFRTDIMQFGFILIMCLACVIMIIFHIPKTSTLETTISTQAITYDLWGIQRFSGVVSFIWNLIMGFFMGLTFIITCPDTWKRVFVVTKYRKARSMVLLFLAGVLPFLLLIPFVFAIRKIDFAEMTSMRFIIILFKEQNSLLLSFILLGIIASFLSSFDSSLIMAVHLLILKEVSKKQLKGNQDHQMLFHKFLGWSFIIIIMAFIILPSCGIRNPYYIVNSLAVPYVIISAILISTRGLDRSLSNTTLLAICIIPTVIWFAYMNTIPDILRFPQVDQISASWICVPFFLILCGFSAKSSIKNKKGNND